MWGASEKEGGVRGCGCENGNSFFCSFLLFFSPRNMLVIIDWAEYKLKLSRILFFNRNQFERGQLRLSSKRETDALSLLN